MEQRRSRWVASDRARSSYRRRGLTLLEILLAIALMLAIFAIALPAVDRTLEERSFEAGVDVASSQLMLARAFARESGAIIEVTYRDEPARLEVRRLDFDSPGTDGAGVVAGIADESDDDPSTLIAASYAVRALPESLFVTPDRPSWMVGPDDLLFDTEPADEPQLVRLVLATFLADGSAIPGDDMWLHDGTERAGVLSVDSFTGLPSFERIEWDPDADPFEELGGPDDEEESGADDQPADEARPDASRRRGTRPRRLSRIMPCSRRASRRTPRGAILLETLVALALFVGAASFTLAALTSVTSRLERARRDTAALDLAQSKLAELEAGLVDLADLRDGEAALRTVGSVEFDESGPLGLQWTLDLETRRTEFTGLVHVRITVREAGASNEETAGTGTVESLVRLSEVDEEFYEEDDLLDDLPDDPGAEPVQ